MVDQAWKGCDRGLTCGSLRRRNAANSIPFVVADSIYIVGVDHLCSDESAKELSDEIGRESSV